MSLALRLISLVSRSRRKLITRAQASIAFRLTTIAPDPPPSPSYVPRACGGFFEGHVSECLLYCSVRICGKGARKGPIRDVGDVTECCQQILPWSATAVMWANHLGPQASPSRSPLHSIPANRRRDERNLLRPATTALWPHLTSSSEARSRSSRYSLAHLPHRLPRVRRRGKSRSRIERQSLGWCNDPASVALFYKEL